MLNIFKVPAVILVLFVTGCNDTAENEAAAPMPLNSHEHKLLLNKDRFEDMESAFSDYWLIVKTVAEEQGLKIREFENGFEWKHNQVAFYDTEDLELNKKGFLIRKRAKYKKGQLDSAFTLTLKFKADDYESASMVDLALAEGYKPKSDEIEVEVDIVAGAHPDSEPSEFYSVQNSVVLDVDTGNTLADYAKIFPVLGTLGLDLSLVLKPVNGIEAEEFIVKTGYIDFGNDLLGRVDMSAWIIDGKIIPEFSYDHPLDNWDDIPSESVNECEAFLAALQEKAPDWYVDGRLKAAFVFER